MANVANRYQRRWELEQRLTTMFSAKRFTLFVNDFTEEGYGDEATAKLALFYVRVKGTGQTVDHHVGTWHKGKRSGWIFQSAYKLFKGATA